MSQLSFCCFIQLQLHVLTILCNIQPTCSGSKFAKIQKQHCFPATGRTVSSMSLKRMAFRTTRSTWPTFIRSPDAIAIGLSHVVLLGDHGNAGATNEIKQGGSIFRCIRCIMPSYLWPHIMCYCLYFLGRDNKTLVDNAEGIYHLFSPQRSSLASLS